MRSFSNLDTLIVREWTLMNNHTNVVVNKNSVIKCIWWEARSKVR